MCVFLWTEKAMAAAFFIFSGLSVITEDLTILRPVVVGGEQPCSFIGFRVRPNGIHIQSFQLAKQQLWPGHRTLTLNPNPQFLHL